MWSGPRNISTALMRSWGNRADTAVCDEPFYAFFLHQTGRIHPGREVTLQQHETDWRKVRDWLLGDVPDGRAIFYQKHMAHHFLREIGRDWLSQVTNCFLIRDPREMLASLLKKIPDATLADTGLPQQVEIFRWVRELTGETPPIIDSRDVLDNPRGILVRLCESLGVEFTDRMLSWPPGPRATDGAWAPYWYAEVTQTTTFQPYVEKPIELPAGNADLLRTCQVLYHELHQHRLGPV